MKTYLLFDAHLEHENITRWTGRPMDFETRLSHACHDVLQAGDHLIIGGDLYLGRLPGLEAAVRAVVPPGVHATLIRGNHDRLSEQAYRRAGLHVTDGLIYRQVLITHYGSQTLPDGVIGQIGGHYHQNPAHPALPNHLKLSLEEQGLRPVNFEWAYRELQRRHLMRLPPERVSDKWFLKDPAYAQIAVHYEDGTCEHAIPKEPYDLAGRRPAKIVMRSKPRARALRALQQAGLLGADHPEPSAASLELPDDATETFHGPLALFALGAVCRLRGAPGPENP